VTFYCNPSTVTDTPKKKHHTIVAHTSSARHPQKTIPEPNPTICININFASFYEYSLPALSASCWIVCLALAHCVSSQLTDYFSYYHICPIIAYLGLLFLSSLPYPATSEVSCPQIPPILSPTERIASHDGFAMKELIQI